MSEINKIDLIEFSKNRNEYYLVMKENEEWNFVQQRLLSIQNRFNVYLHFILEGQMEKLYPNSKNSKITIVLECPNIKDEKIIFFFNSLAKELIKYNIAILIKEI